MKPTFTDRIVDGFRDPSWTKLLLGKEIHNGEIMPTGYGYAWHEWNRDVIVMVPIPLNFVVQFARWAYYQLRTKHVKARIDNAYWDGLARGREQERQCYEIAYIDMRRKVFDDLIAELDKRGKSH